MAAAPGVSQAEHDAMSLREQQLARRAAERRCAELTAALHQTQKALDAARRENADLMVRCRRAEDDLETLRLRVANLLGGRSESERDRHLKEALASLRAVRESESDLCRQVRTFKTYLETVLDVLRPSRPLRREILARYDKVLGACERLERQPPVVAGRGGMVDGRLECRVLAVNDDLQTVVLDAGSTSGLRVGAAARVMSQGREVAGLRVVEVRPRLSAAVPISGSLRNIAPGALVQIGERPRK